MLIFQKVTFYYIIYYQKITKHPFPVYFNPLTVIYLKTVSSEIVANKSAINKNVLRYLFD